MGGGGGQEVDSGEERGTKRKMTERGDRDGEKEIQRERERQREREGERGRDRKRERQREKKERGEREREFHNKYAIDNRERVPQQIRHHTYNYRY